MTTFDQFWEKMHQAREWGKYPSEEIIRFVARNYYEGNRAKRRLLDLGCGTGAVTWYLAREGFDAYGIDGSKTAIKKAKQIMRKEGLKANLFVGDAGKLIFTDKYFDGIIDSGMLYAHRSEAIKIILKECFRILKENGKFFSKCLFEKDSTGYAEGEKIERNTYRHIIKGPFMNKGTIHFFDEKEIIQRWRDAGFKNLKIDLLKRTEMGGKVKISYFMVEAEK